MLKPEQMKDHVLRFFKSWEKGTFDDLRNSYREFLAPDVLYQNSGVPDCNGIEASLRLIESVCLLDCMKIQTIRVELKAIAVGENCVFTERIDYHYDDAGVDVLVPYICGVMVFDKNGKIGRWSDYYDPGPMVKALESRAKAHAA